MKSRETETVFSKKTRAHGGAISWIQKELKVQKCYQNRLLGEEAVNRVLKNIVEKYSRKSDATTLDLLDELYKAATPAQHILIDDWMKRVITYDVKVSVDLKQKIPEKKSQFP